MYFKQTCIITRHSISIISLSRGTHLAKQVFNVVKFLGLYLGIPLGIYNPALTRK